MTWLWLFSMLSISETGDDYGDWAVELAQQHAPNSRCNKVIKIGWELACNPSLIRD